MICPNCHTELLDKTKDVIYNVVVYCRFCYLKIGEWKNNIFINIFKGVQKDFEM